MGRTLVTGATGFIGAHVARLLVARGDEVVVTVRRDSPLAGLDGLAVRRVRADMLDRRAVRRAMQGVARVFHIAGTTNLRAARDEAFPVAVEGTRIVLEEALRAGAQRVVYTSSAGTIGPARAGRNADETTGWGAGRYAIPYLDAMHQAEALALGMVARGLAVVVVNPAHVFGAGDPGRSSTALVRRFLRREIPAYVDGTLNVVAVQDVARGHLLADERGQVGERYILGNRNFTMTRLFADLGRLSGVQPPALKLPVLAAMTLADAAQRLGQTHLPTPAEVRAASLNWSFSNRKAKRELGWSTSPHEDCLEETIEWYRRLDGDALAPPGATQPLPLRVVGDAARRIGL
jgi:dihydroflavonol-4-reductase